MTTISPETIAQQRKQLVVRLQHEVFERADLSFAEQVLAPDYIDHAAPPGTPTGPAAMRAVAGFLHGGLDDLRYDMHQILCDGDLLAFRCTVSGTHVRPFLGHPPTGRRFHVEHLHLLRFAGSHIAEHWAVRDDLGMFAQLGFLAQD